MKTDELQNKKKKKLTGAHFYTLLPGAWHSALYVNLGTKASVSFT